MQRAVLKKRTAKRGHLEKRGLPNNDSLSSPHRNGAQVGHPHASTTEKHDPLRKAQELADTLKDLVKLAREQGYLSYDDLNEALPGDKTGPADLDEILTELRNLDIEIIDPADIDQPIQTKDESDDERESEDPLDDPVRMYMRQMGKVPLLTREQEVE